MYYGISEAEISKLPAAVQERFRISQQTQEIEQMLELEELQRRAAAATGAIGLTPKTVLIGVAVLGGLFFLLKRKKRAA